jgi:hypothetical protein
MNHVHRVCRSLASLTRRASILPAPAVAGPASAAAARPGPSRPATHSLPPAPVRAITTSKPRADARSAPPRERLRTTVLPARLPHAIMTPMQSPAQTALTGSSRIPRTLGARLCVSLCVAVGTAGIVLCGCGSSASASHTTRSLPLGVFPGPSPGSYVVDCFAAQCTTQPGAGPFGTTCRTPNTSTDEQYCPASRPRPARPAAQSPVPTASS